MSEQPIIGGRYRIIEPLSQGAFGQTYLAEDLQIPGHPKCVVKQLKPNAKDDYTITEAQRLFNIEAEVLARLGEHPQIPRLLAHYAEQFYLVQEYIDGQDLSHEIGIGFRLSEAEVVRLLQNVLPVLGFIHQNGVIHRDLKPSNLIRRASDNKIVLIDFGAVKEIKTMMLGTGGQLKPTVAIGTLGYMPPEQLERQPRFNSDIYALGMMAIQALTGVLPDQLERDEQTGEVLWQHRARVSDRLAMILNKMVRRNFTERYQSASEALQAFQETQAMPHSVPPTAPSPSQPTVPQPTVPQPTVGKRRTLPKWAIFGGIGTAVVVVGGIFLLPAIQAMLLFDRATGLLEAGKAQEALAIYDRILERSPNAVDVLINKGYALSQLKRVEEQLGTCTKALSLAPDDIDALNCQAVALKGLGRNSESLAVFERLLALKPDNPDGWHNKGEVLAKLARFDEALATFDKALLYDPNYVFSHNGRGDVLFQLQRYPEAIAAYNKAIELDANYRYAWNGRGNSERLMQRYDIALSNYEKALQIDPNFYEAWYGKGLALLGLNRPEEAIAALDQAIKIKPDYTAAIQQREQLR